MTPTVVSCRGYFYKLIAFVCIVVICCSLLILSVAATAFDATIENTSTTQAENLESSVSPEAVYTLYSREEAVARRSLPNFNHQNSNDMTMIQLYIKLFMRRHRPILREKRPYPK